MEFEIKTRYFIIVGILLLLFAFFSGYCTHDYYTKNRIAELGSNLTNLENQLATEIDRNRELTNGLTETKRILDRLREENNSLIETNKRLTETAVHIADGIGEDIGTISNLESRIQSFIDGDSQAETKP